MPFAQYPDFDSCVRSVMRKKKWKKDRASAYCAVIERKIAEARKKSNWEMIDADSN